MVKIALYDLPRRYRDPTPLEIARECSYIQQSWDARTKLARRLGIAEEIAEEIGDWTVPEIPTRQLDQPRDDEF